MNKTKVMIHRKGYYAHWIKQLGCWYLVRLNKKKRKVMNEGKAVAFVKGWGEAKDKLREMYYGKVPFRGWDKVYLRAEDTDDLNEQVFNLINK